MKPLSYKPGLPDCVGEKGSASEPGESDPMSWNIRAKSGPRDRYPGYTGDPDLGDLGFVLGGFGICRKLSCATFFAAPISQGQIA